MDHLQAQLYGVLGAQGMVWVVGHCPAMCGPLVIALRFHGIGGVLAYQTGKALTYAMLGAIAGAVGGMTIFLLRDYAPWLLAATAAVMVMSGLRSLFSGGVHGVAAAQAPGWLARAVQRWSITASPSPSTSTSTSTLTSTLPLPLTSVLRVMVLGALLAFLPCAVVMWALGLAVASASPLHGALLMVGLVLLNTPVLMAAHLLGAAAWLAGLRRRLRWLPALGLLVAGAWLGWLAFSVGAPGCHA